MRTRIYLGLLLLLPACQLKTQADKITNKQANEKKRCRTIEEIPPPAGYTRIPAAGRSFSEWLRSLPLKIDRRVFLYNGLLKADQTVSFRVIDIPIGKRDLLQCADAAMMLRARYLFSNGDFDSIHFAATDGTVMSFVKWRMGIRYKTAGNRLTTFLSEGNHFNTQTDFENYLEIVFSYAGTTSLAKELKPVSNSNDIQPGDVFIKPGFPGHAMMVADVAINREGEKIFMLVQGYMPAQDIHIVKNLENEEISPWYKIPASGPLVTPEWIFDVRQLKRWQ